MGEFKKITGTFIDEITYDIPSSNWSYEDWKKELDFMMEDGIDTLIFIRGGYKDKTIYPSEYFGTKGYTDDLLGFFLCEAEKRNMKVIVGLYNSTIDWNNGDYKKETEYNRHFINEVWSKYGDIPSFGGWYVPQEVSFERLNIVEVTKNLSELCKEKSEKLPVMLSPYFNSEIISPDDFFTPERHYEEWDRMFDRCAKNLDIIAFQDGTAPMNLMKDYYLANERLCKKYRMENWVNTETFERDVRCMYYPIPFNDLKRKLEIHQDYADKIITFEYSHFLSPQSIYPSAQNLNKRYKEYLQTKK